ncbi:MAG: FAD-dependent oxidoreductase [Deltaproteobacteria bacterium]|nr:FAD-dependent oxidoreductase [Candidatus Anaeroferrophillacea bacterium]
MTNRGELVIVGGGYAGLACLRTAARGLPAGWRIRLVDAGFRHQVKARFHERVARPSRDRLVWKSLGSLAAAAGAEWVQDTVIELDPGRQWVVGRRETYRYDILVLAAGAGIAYFGIPGAAEHAIHTQEYESVVRGCRRVQELASRAATGERVRLAVSGAGVEGVEVAAMVRRVLPRPAGEVILTARSADILPRAGITDAQRAYVREYCRRTGIELQLDTAATAVTAAGLEVAGDCLAADLVLWCAGVRPRVLPGMPDGRPLTVNRFLQSERWADVFAVGDVAVVAGGTGDANQASAQRAVFHGDRAGANVRRLVAGKPLRRVDYHSHGELIALGDGDGVGIVGGVPLCGLKVALLKRVNEWRYAAMLRSGRRRR